MKKSYKFISAMILTAVMSVPAFAGSSLDNIIISGVKSGSERIDVSSLSVSAKDAVEAYKELYSTSPAMYAAAQSVRCESLDGKATTLMVDYIIDPVSTQSLVDGAIARATASASGTDYDKAKYVHDYIISNTTADYSSGFTTYDLLIGGKGCCSAYSLTFKACMDKLGIPCEVVISDAINHQWNMVKLDGNWYHVDVYWDKNYTDQTGTLSYANFAMSDIMAEVQGHSNWTVEGNLKATATDHDMDI